MREQTISPGRVLLGRSAQGDRLGISCRRVYLADRLRLIGLCPQLPQYVCGCGMCVLMCLFVCRCVCLYVFVLSVCIFVCRSVCLLFCRQKTACVDVMCVCWRVCLFVRVCKWSFCLFACLIVCLVIGSL